MVGADNILYLTVFKYFQLFSPRTDKVSHYISCNKVTSSSRKLFYIYLTTFWLNFHQHWQQTNTVTLTKFLRANIMVIPCVPGVTWCRAPDQLGCFMILVGGVWCRVWDASRWSSAIITWCHPSLRCYTVSSNDLARYSDQVLEYRVPSTKKMPRVSTRHPRSGSNSKSQYQVGELLL